MTNEVVCQQDVFDRINEKMEAEKECLSEFPTGSLDLVHRDGWFVEDVSEISKDGWLSIVPEVSPGHASLACCIWTQLLREISADPSTVYAGIERNKPWCLHQVQFWSFCHLAQWPLLGWVAKCSGYRTGSYADNQIHRGFLCLPVLTSMNQCRNLKVQDTVLVISIRTFLLRRSNAIIKTLTRSSSTRMTTTHSCQKKEH